MSTTEFGEWDAESSSFYNLGPASSSGPLRSFTTTHLVSIGSSPAPLPEESFQAAESAYISYPPTPISDEHRSVTPELRYPSPVPSPSLSLQHTQVSAVRSTFIHEPSPRPQSLPPTSRGQELFAATGGRFSASPIDYEASARRIVEENPDDVELQTVLGFPPPTTTIVEPPRPRVPSPVADIVDNIENIPPVPVIRLPPCAFYEGHHPHQFVLVATQRGVELRVPDLFSHTVSQTFLVIPFNISLQDTNSCNVPPFSLVSLHSASLPPIISLSTRSIEKRV